MPLKHPQPPGKPGNRPYLQAATAMIVSR